jgi:hypothetical protein
MRMPTHRAPTDPSSTVGERRFLALSRPAAVVYAVATAAASTSRTADRVITALVSAKGRARSDADGSRRARSCTYVEQ